MEHNFVEHVKFLFQRQHQVKWIFAFYKLLELVLMANQIVK